MTQNKELDVKSTTVVQNKGEPYREYKYRWVILALTALCLIVNGLANNAIIPIAKKISIVYGIKPIYVESPITLSFLIYSLMNFPANHLTDTKGLRLSFLFGSGLYAIGLGFYTLINQSYAFVLLGSILIALGQPFIINSPAKIATYWFLNENRPVATAVMIGFSTLGTGIGFTMPALSVAEDSVGEAAKQEIYNLFCVEFLVALTCFFLIFLLMRMKPPTPPSRGAAEKKTDLKESFQIFKNDRNLWKFFGGYILIYGSFLLLGSAANLLLKPYGFTDVQIAFFAISLIVSGITGSIVVSVLLKKTGRYKLFTRVISALSFCCMVSITLVLNLSADFALTVFACICIGFSFTPIVPISYDLGCELAFPMGEAQVTGILNGGAMIFTFFMSIVASSILDTKFESTIVMIMLAVTGGIGVLFYFQVKIDLKRKNIENNAQEEKMGEGMEGVEESVNVDVDMEAPSYLQNTTAETDPGSNKIFKLRVKPEKTGKSGYNTFVDEKQ